MSRSEFKQSIRMAAWERCGGKCEGCTAKLYPGKFQYDHVQADGLGGEATLENCKVLCTACHHKKTTTHDRPIMQKADNIKKKHFGFKAKRSTFACSRDSQWKKKMDGSVVRRTWPPHSDRR